MRSILDRLQDVPLPEDAGRAMSINEFRDVVARDLEMLLNTRSEGARTIADAFEQCRKSSLTYGILDYSSFSLLSPQDRDRIRRSLEQSIALHEPRLTRIRVQLEKQRPFERTVRFRVDAMLNLGADRERVQFDAVLQLNTQLCQVR